METIIHLKTKDSFQMEGKTEKSNTILMAFQNACLRLDVGIFEPFMSEDDCFEDSDKYRFLSSLKSQFDAIKSRASYEPEAVMEDSICRGCSYGKPVKVFSFYQHNGNMKLGSFGYLIDMENGILKDIYQCNAIRLESSGLNPEIVDSILSKYIK